MRGKGCGGDRKVQGCGTSLVFRTRIPRVNFPIKFPGIREKPSKGLYYNFSELDRENLPDIREKNPGDFEPP